MKTLCDSKTLNDPTEQRNTWNGDKWSSSEFISYLWSHKNGVKNGTTRNVFAYHNNNGIDQCGWPHNPFTCLFWNNFFSPSSNCYDSSIGVDVYHGWFASWSLLCSGEKAISINNNVRGERILKCHSVNCCHFFMFCNECVLNKWNEEIAAERNINETTSRLSEEIVHEKYTIARSKTWDTVDTSVCSDTPGLMGTFVRNIHASSHIRRDVFRLYTMLFRNNPYLLNENWRQKCGMKEKMVCDNVYSLPVCVRDYHMQSARRCKCAVRPSNGCEIAFREIQKRNAPYIFPPNLVSLFSESANLVK